MRKLIIEKAIESKTYKKRNLNFIVDYNEEKIIVEI